MEGTRASVLSMPLELEFLVDWDDASEIKAHRQCFGPSVHACSPAAEPEPEVVDLASTILASTVFSLVPSLVLPRSSEFYSDKPQSPSQVSSSKPSPSTFPQSLPSSGAKSQRLHRQGLPCAGLRTSPPLLINHAHMPTVLSAHGPCPLVSASVTTPAVSAHFPLPAGRMSSSF